MQEITPLTLTVNDVCAISSLSRTTIYAAIREGSLTALKCGHRTLIKHQDLRAWIESLPRLTQNSAA